ncbi:hypothetical protein CC86DRAFT_117544 [Ophiobolus disseminans]|uniref:Uncharacterized protein n=1 Tax=Ophiobolus disseminans TaxID=1469910 RepID=A0A6A6ZI81_9PLEO|nr:hypothetical protein CC86DRAFT_117544 [Ophiobolus disseminans]
MRASWQSSALGLSRIGRLCESSQPRTSLATPSQVANACYLRAGYRICKLGILRKLIRNRYNCVWILLSGNLLNCFRSILVHDIGRIVLIKRPLCILNLGIPPTSIWSPLIILQDGHISVEADQCESPIVLVTRVRHFSTKEVQVESPSR